MITTLKIEMTAVVMEPLHRDFTEAVGECSGGTVINETQYRHFEVGVAEDIGGIFNTFSFLLFFFFFPFEQSKSN